MSVITDISTLWNRFWSCGIWLLASVNTHVVE